MFCTYLTESKLKRTQKINGGPKKFKNHPRVRFMIVMIVNLPLYGTGYRYPRNISIFYFNILIFVLKTRALIRLPSFCPCCKMFIGPTETAVIKLRVSCFNFFLFKNDLNSSATYHRAVEDTKNV